ncbi:unnamed protein product [Musa acuminata subsp. burmannicoides]
MVAEDDERRVSQHQDRSSSGARWTVEVVTDILHQPCLHLESCHGRYLAAPLRNCAFLRLAGTKAAQKFPSLVVTGSSLSTLTSALEAETGLCGVSVCVQRSRMNRLLVPLHR